MAKNRVTAHLACEDCKARNYTNVISKKRASGALKLKKYCNKCRSHKSHKETK